MCEEQATLVETIRSNHILARAALSSTPETYSVYQTHPPPPPTNPSITLQTDSDRHQAAGSWIITKLENEERRVTLSVAREFSFELSGYDRVTVIYETQNKKKGHAGATQDSCALFFP